MVAFDELDDSEDASDQDKTSSEVQCKHVPLPSNLGIVGLGCWEFGQSVMVISGDYNEAGEDEQLNKETSDDDLFTRLPEGIGDHEATTCPSDH